MRRGGRRRRRRGGAARAPVGCGGGRGRARASLAASATASVTGDRRARRPGGELRDPAGEALLHPLQHEAVGRDAAGSRRPRCSTASGRIQVLNCWGVNSCAKLEAALPEQRDRRHARGIGAGVRRADACGARNRACARRRARAVGEPMPAARGSSELPSRSRGSYPQRRRVRAKCSARGGELSTGADSDRSRPPLPADAARSPPLTARAITRSNVRLFHFKADRS